MATSVINCAGEQVGEAGLEITAVAHGDIVFCKREFLMSQGPDWKEAAEFFMGAGADGSQTTLVVGEICQYIARSQYCSEIKIVDTTLCLGNSTIYISKADDLHPQKRIKVMPITGERLEICLSDSQTGAENCSFPHPTAEEGFERFMGILKTLDWSKTVKDDKDFFERWRRFLLGKSPKDVQ